VPFLSTKILKGEVILVKIIKDFISASQKKQRPGYKMNPKYITVHNTANSSKALMQKCIAVTCIMVQVVVQ
jgi:hypothetical protein